VLSVKSAVPSGFRRDRREVEGEMNFTTGFLVLDWLLPTSGLCQLGARKDMILVGSPQKKINTLWSHQTLRFLGNPLAA
jgi:hypothetical protein